MSISLYMENKTVLKTYSGIKLFQLLSYSQNTDTFTACILKITHFPHFVNGKTEEK